LYENSDNIAISIFSMSSIWDYIVTGGHLYKKSFWKTEYEQIAHEKGVTPDHVYAIAKGCFLMDETDREIKELLRRKGVLTSVFE